MPELLSIKEASQWASEYLNKNITPSNISYLIQYGRISKVGDNGFAQVLKEELVEYYKDQNKSRQDDWKKQLGDDFFSFERNDELEIVPLFIGQGIQARDSYIDGITQVLTNSKKYLQDDYDIFLVSNDKYNMYPTIAEKAGMKIVNQYKRPVLNRTEKDKSAYAEIIFHLKAK